MAKFLKWIGILLGVVVLLAILAIVLLITFVSPNRLKPLLTEQVMKYSDRTLTIDGDMAWTFFPYFGVKVGHLTLSNPPGFGDKTFAEISQATVSVKLIPLLHSKIESSGIKLDGMKLHFIKNKQGQGNWDFEKPVSKTKASTAAGNDLSTNKRAMLGLAISSVEVNNAEIDYIDEQTNKKYAINQFDLQAKDISLLEPFALKMAFDFVASHPAASGHIALAGNTALNVTAQIYTLRDLQFSANLVQENKKINVNLQGDLMADLNQQIVQWNRFKGNVANISIAGKINVTDLMTKPLIAGHVFLQPFDLKEALIAFGQPVANLQVAKNAKGVADFTVSANDITVLSDLSMETLQAAKITLTDITMKAHFQKGILDLAPLSAKLYQGTFAGQGLVNLNNAAPQITLHAKLANIQAQPLMEDLGGKEQKIKLAGVGNFEMQITTAGVETKALLQNLNGVCQFSFNNGAIIGIDLGYLVDSAYAVMHGQVSNATDHNQTNFGMLTGTGAIRGGVLTNNDLLADTPRFAIHGAGTHDLANQKIDYNLQTMIKQRADQKDNLLNLYGITLPVLVTGDLASPTVRLDSAAIAKAVAQQQLQKVTNQAKEKLQEQLKKQVPEDLLKGKAGDMLNNLLGK